MPVKRAQLNRQQKAKYMALVQDLQAVQLICAIPGEREDEEKVHELDIFAAPPEGNILCELSSGVTAYAIWVRLIALGSNLMLENCEIVSDWDSESIVLWQSQRGLYRVESAINLTDAEVLNHRIESGLRFHHRGDVEEGWLVASGLKSIPERYGDQTVTNLRVTFTDQFGRDHSTHTQALLQRPAPLKNSLSRVRNSLFETEGSEMKVWPEVPGITPRRQPECSGGDEHQWRGRQKNDGSVAGHIG